MKRCTFALVSVVCFVFFSCSTAESPNVTKDPVETEVYHTDFMTAPSGWINAFTSSDGYCTINVDSGSLKMINTGNNKIYYEFAPHPEGTAAEYINGPYAIESEMQVDCTGTTAGKAASGFVFNYQDSSNYYVFYLSGYGGFKISQVSLGQWVSANPVNWTSGFGNTVGLSNNIKLVQNASFLKVYINGTLAGSYPIALPAGNLYVGVISYSMETTLNPISVTSSFKDFHIYKYN